MRGCACRERSATWCFVGLRSSKLDRIRERMNHSEYVIDRGARDKASQIFRGLISGKISNNAFADACPGTDDRAVLAIWDTAWLFYNDFKDHHLTGRYRLSPEQRRACVRWNLFLQGDLPYVWPDIRFSGADPAARVEPSVLRRLLFSSSTIDPERAASFLAAGHYPVWPFQKVADYKQNLTAPRLLAGHRG